MKAKPAVVASGRFARSTVDKSDSFQGDLTRTAVKHSTAGVVLVALALAVQSVNAHADTPPKLNMVPTCDAAASYAGLADRDKTSCMTDENDALAALRGAAIDAMVVGRVEAGPRGVELVGPEFWSGTERGAMPVADHGQQG